MARHKKPAPPAKPRGEMTPDAAVTLLLKAAVVKFGYPLDPDGLGIVVQLLDESVPTMLKATPVGGDYVAISLTPATQQTPPTAESRVAELEARVAELTGKLKAATEADQADPELDAMIARGHVS